MTAASFDGTRIGSALLVSASRGASRAAARLAGALPADPDRLLVVADSPSQQDNDALWRMLAATLRGQGPVRLVMPGAGSGGLAAPAQWLADRIDTEVVAPDGRVVDVAGTMAFVVAEGFVGNESGLWLSFRPGTGARPLGPRFPEPRWERQSPPRRWLTGPAGMVEAIPAGLWFQRRHPLPWTRREPSAPLFGLPAADDVLAIVIGSPGDPAPPIDELPTLLRALPSWEQRAVCLMPYGLPVGDASTGAIGQLLANMLGERVVTMTGLPTIRDGRPGTVTAYDSAGRGTWQPLATEIAYRPRRGADQPSPVVMSCRPPLAGLHATAPGVFPLESGLVLEVVQSGLWLREDQLPVTTTLVRDMPLDPDHARLTIGMPGRETSAALIAAANQFAPRVEPRLRPFLRLVPISAPPHDGTAGPPPAHDARATAAMPDAGAAMIDAMIIAADPGRPMTTRAAPSSTVISSPDIPEPPREPAADAGEPTPDRPVPDAHVAHAEDVRGAGVRAAGPAADDTAPTEVDAAELGDDDASAGETGADDTDADTDTDTDTDTDELDADGFGDGFGDEESDIAARIASEYAAPASPAGRSLWLSLSEPASPPVSTPPPTTVSSGGSGASRPGQQQQDPPPAEPRAADSRARADDEPRPQRPMRRARTTQQSPMTGVPTLPAEGREAIETRHASTPDERAALRQWLGSRHDRYADDVRRVIANQPALRGLTSESVDAVVTDLVAVRVYLAEHVTEVEAALRAGRLGQLRPLVACVVSGLRRLPSYRGGAICGGHVEPAAGAALPGTVITERAFRTAVTAADHQVPGSAEFLIWSATSRRLDSLEPEAARRRVVFLPGSSFRVLGANDPSAPRRRVLLRQISSGESRDGLEADDVAIRDRLATFAATRDDAGVDATDEQTGPSWLDWDIGWDIGRDISRDLGRGSGTAASDRLG